VFQKLVNNLRRGGYIVLGKSESVFSDSFKYEISTYSIKDKIFYKE